MEDVASNNTWTMIKNFPVYAGRNKDTFGEYKGKVHVCLSLNVDLVFEVFEGMPRLPSCLDTVDTTALDITADQRW